MQNERVINIEKSKLSDNWYRLDKVSFDFKNNDGTWERHSREVYDRGNGACILLYNTLKKSVILTRQFRMPTYLNGNKDGFLIEACAGLLDNDNPADCIRKETEEETGYRLDHIQKVFEAYMSPGSVTEILYFYIARYSDDMKVTQGGGAVDEEEDIEVLEIPLSQCLDYIKTGTIKDGKTIMLLQYLELNRKLVGL